MLWIAANWRWLLPLISTSLLLIALGLTTADRNHWKAKANRYGELRVLDKLTYEKAQSEAASNNMAIVFDSERRQAANTEAKEQDIETQLASARALAADYARRLRAQRDTAQGTAGAAGLPEAADASGLSASAGGDALVPVDDLRICADNTVKSKAWQDWYAAASKEWDAALAVPTSPTTP